MRKRIVALAASAASILALTLGAAPAHAADTSISYYTAITFDNGLCLDVPNSNAYSGAYVQQWGCNSTQAQKWKIHYVDSSHFTIASTLDSNLCLNDWEGTASYGDHIRLYPCSTSDTDSLFNLYYEGGYPGGGPIWDLQPKRSSNLCVNMWGGDQVSNLARLYYCENASNENVHGYGLTYF
jgi:hypothetical protein